MKNYYELLDVQPTASKEEIEHAFKHKIRGCHPDKIPPHLDDNIREYSTQLVKDLNKARAILTDSSKRYEYDQTLAPHPPSSPSVQQAPTDGWDNDEDTEGDADRSRAASNGGALSGTLLNLVKIFITGSLVSILLILLISISLRIFLVKAEEKRSRRQVEMQVSELLEAAKEKEASGKPASAYGDLLKLLSLDPENSHAQQLLGEIRLRNHKNPALFREKFKYPIGGDGRGSLALMRDGPIGGMVAAFNFTSGRLGSNAVYTLLTDLDVGSHSYLPRYHLRLGNDEDLFHLSFSKDGHMLATKGPSYNTIDIWDLRKREAYWGFESKLLAPESDESRRQGAYNGSLLVSHVHPLGPGEKAGIKAEDLIVSVNGLSIREYLASGVTHRPRENVDLIIKRAGVELKTSIKLSDSPTHVKEVRYDSGYRSLLGQKVYAFEFNGQGDIVIGGDCASKAPTLALVDVETGHVKRKIAAGKLKPRNRWTPSEEPVSSLALNEDYQEVFVGCGKIVVLDLASGAEKYRLPGHIGNVTIKDLAVQGNKLVSRALRGHEGEILLWDLESRQELSNLLNRKPPIAGHVDMSKNGDIVVGSSDGKIYVMSWETQEILAVLKGHERPISSLHLTQDGATLISADSEYMRLWGI